MAGYSFTSVSAVPITWPLAAFTVWLIGRLLFRRGYRQGSSPPGPRPWPVIGNLNLIGPIPHQSLYELSQAYGPLMQLKFGSSSVVVTNSPDMAKEFLKTHDSKFASRPQLAAGKYTVYNFSDMTWAAYGPHWRQGRKVFLTHLFSSKRLDSYEYIRVEERTDLLKQLYDLRGNEVRIRCRLSRLNLNIMSRVVLGKKYSSDSEHLRAKPADDSVMSVEELQVMLEEIILLNGVFTIGDWVPWLARLDLEGYVKRMKNLSKKFDKFIEFVIEEHKTARATKRVEALDMTDVLLDLIDDPDLEVKWTVENVKAFTVDLLAGGTDTAATTVEWAMTELMKNPEKMKKATEELDGIIGRERWVEERDTPNLPYLDAIMKETMRLHPAATLLAPHLALEDCKIKNYDISKGTVVLINTWSMGRDPTIWESPEEFRPERFLNKDIDIKGKSFELLPFGSGRRMCPGYTLGLKMIKSSLANLVHGFNWTLPQEMKPKDLDVEEIYGLTTPRKNPLVAVVEPRLPPHLYT
uniref:Flavonoid 3'-monooxygenase n=1 Tax=Kalanchoe fedtschenkoi TaxID=63787 RepID=A0A7N0V2S2_KALFE